MGIQSLSQRIGVIASSGGHIPLVDGKFVIIASGASNGNRINYSLDGKHWNTGAISDRDWRTVSFDKANKKFIVTGSNIAFTAYSSDGISFTTVGHPIALITGAVNETGTAIAVGVNTARYSTDGGVNWTTTTIPSGTYYAAEWSQYNGKFFAFATNGVRVSSSDGITWTTLTAGSATSWVNIDTNDVTGRMVAISYSNPTNVVSSDNGGTTWSAAASAGIDANGAALKWVPAPRSHWAAGTQSGSQGLFTSATGAAGTFTRQTGSGANVFGLAYSPELNILVSANFQSYPQYSTDNASAVWTQGSNVAANTWQDIAWGNFA
ncbi:hypothetical protein D3C72_320170 [compost metagenome]